MNKTTIIAFDEANNIFEKELTIKQEQFGLIVSLGLPTQWYLTDIQHPPTGGGDLICLDAMGRNHKGYPVYCSHKELLEKVEKLQLEEE